MVERIRKTEQRREADQKGWAGKLTGVLSGLGCARSFCPLTPGVKRTQKTAPPNHAAVADSANSRSRLNCVVRMTLCAKIET